MTLLIMEDQLENTKIFGIRACLIMTACMVLQYREELAPLKCILSNNLINSA